MLHGPPSGPCCECQGDPLCNYTGNVAPNTRLGIPQIKMNDGPQGFRDNNHPGTSTAWPSALTVAAAWDEELMLQWGIAMGKEFFDKGANVQLGPGMNVARVPKNGRNFEYLSGEDGFLGYTLVQPVVRGIQSQNVIANAKHYVLNNQETNRGSVSDNADERTRFEIYYQPFWGASDAGVGSMMCSYNKIYFTWSCENNETLATDLKERMGFKGFVMSDWGATHSTSIVQGLDIEMPGADFMGAKLLQQVQAGRIPESYVDEAVLRILTPMFAVGVFDTPNPNVRSNNVTSEAHNDLARRLSAASTVLLQNNGVLPLATSARIAVLGWAGSNAYTHGGGSGTVSPARVITPLQGIATRVDSAAQITFNDGSNITAAAEAAAAAEVAVVFVGCNSGEGSDRSTLGLDGNGNALIAAVARAQPKTVVVVATPGAVLTPWAASVAAVLTNFMPGQEVGSAIADVLFGQVNPSGRLPLTFPVGENDEQFTDLQYPGLPPSNPVYANYTEGLFFGYRWYDAHNVAPAFPFGHGLSYTTFAYDSLVVSGQAVSFSVRNSGRVPGAEVAQLYIGFPASAGEPPKVLRGFRKVFLGVNEQQTITFVLRDRDLSIWDAGVHAWQQIHGTFGVFVGASSRDIRLSGQFNF